MFTLVGFFCFLYGLYELVTFNFWAKAKRPRRARIRRRPHRTWITQFYDTWWPQSLRFYSFRPRKHNYSKQFAVREQIKKENERTKWGR